MGCEKEFLILSFLSFLRATRSGNSNIIDMTSMHALLTFEDDLLSSPVVMWRAIFKVDLLRLVEG